MARYNMTIEDNEGNVYLPEISKDMISPRSITFVSKKVAYSTNGGTMNFDTVRSVAQGYDADTSIAQISGGDSAKINILKPGRYLLIAVFAIELGITNYHGGNITVRLSNPGNAKEVAAYGNTVQFSAKHIGECTGIRDFSGGEVLYADYNIDGASNTSITTDSYLQIVRIGEKNA